MTLHPMNKRRVASAKAGLSAYAKSTRGRTYRDLHPDDKPDLVGDILCDLMHACAAEDLDFERALASGRINYEYESAPGYKGD